MTTSCVPATIQFTDQSTIPPGAGTITSWSGILEMVAQSHDTKSIHILIPLPVSILFRYQSQAVRVARVLLR